MREVPTPKSSASKRIRRPISPPPDPLDQLFSNLQQSQALKTISDFVGNKSIRYVPPKKYQTLYKTIAMHKQLAEKVSPFLNKKQVMGRIHGFLHNEFAMVNVPEIPRARLHQIERFIRDFFRHTPNKNSVYFQSIWTPRHEYRVYAIKVKSKINVLIYTDGEISEVHVMDL